MTNGLDPVLNFEVTPSWDKRVLVVTDISDWKHLIDEPSYIEITLPGSKTAVRHSYSKNKVMVFNASSLKYGCSSGCEDELPPLPDGIYKIKIYVCEGTQFSYEKTVQGLFRYKTIGWPCNGGKDANGRGQK